MEYRIKELLREKKCNVTELADKVGMQRETLSRIINGASTSSDTLQKIADALGVPISELFEHPDTSTIKCPKCGTELEVKVKNL